MKTNADKPSKTVDPIVRRLRALVKDSPDLRDAAQVYEIILPILRDADLCVAEVSDTPEQVRAKLQKGLPLLHGHDLDLDVQAVRELMLRLARAVETTSGKRHLRRLQLFRTREWHGPDTAARKMRLALEGNRLDVGALLPHIAAGEKDAVTIAGQDLQIDPDLLWTLAQNALKPALRAWCRQLTPLAKGIPWNQGTCFVCGAVATLAELQGNDQVKHLRCGQCGADWQFSRLRCMYCGNEDHRTLNCLYGENRQKMYVEVCDRCGGYLKVIAAFAPAPPEMIPVEDLATLHLDYIARQRGYARVFAQ